MDVSAAHPPQSLRPSAASARAPGRRARSSHAASRHPTRADLLQQALRRRSRGRTLPRSPPGSVVRVRHGRDRGGPPWTTRRDRRGRRSRGRTRVAAPHLRALRLARRQSPELAPVLAIHRDQQIKIKKVLRANLALVPSSTMPRARAAAAARASGGLPTCHAPVPADSSSMLSCRPLRSTSARITPSAVGERQMLPKHTNSTRFVCPSRPPSARAAPSCAPATR